MVKVKFTAEARKELQQICQHLTMKTFSFGSSRKLKQGIKNAITTLSAFPKIGMKEPLLENAGNFRYLVVQKHYKLIYILKDDICYVASIWDCRNNPELLKSRFMDENP